MQQPAEPSGAADPADKLDEQTEKEERLLLRQVP